MRKISRTVWILSLVSLFTDVSSEMLYPVMPLYLKSIGFSVVLIGILEGIAEATAGLSKGYFGKLSDVRAKRLPFVQLGYFFSALSKPMMAIFTWPLWVFSARTLDRLGKGIRTGARDALLSAEATPQTRATVFGFHRSMDTLGAAIGPLLALAFLYFYPGSYRTLFFLAFVPGLIGVFTTFWIREKPMEPKPSTKRPGLFSFLKYIPRSKPEYRWLLGGLIAFTLFNSSDIFLLLMLKHHGLSDTEMIGAYIFYNLIYALCAYPIGILADKIGLKKMFIAGLLIFALTYFGMAVASETWMFFLLFIGYGVYAAATEGVSKAWISNVCKKEDTATAIGTYEGLRSIATMLSSTLAGLIWFYYSPETAFILTAVAVLIIAVFFMKVPYARVTGSKP